MSITAKSYIEHEDLALVPTLHELDGINIRVIHQATTDPSSGTFPFVIEYDDVEELEDTLDSDHTVSDYERIDSNNGTNIYHIRHTDEAKLISPAVTQANGFLLQAETKDKGWLIQAQLPSRDALHSVWERARENDISFSLLELYEKRKGGSSSSFGLTEEQQKALEIAYEKGYFSEPREMSLEDVANEVGVSSTAMSGRLRRGMRNLLSSTLIEDQE
ncbi:helix-turn-helix domain-containing protein [Haloarchaeobius amylolyticus]|uniref:Helix-turn-helix domain-containing protein n=1 Tax=Haloarchaeobius amylolyticus TaxID=1198296 RepID=A0ABD6BBX5_9EURY